MPVEANPQVVVRRARAEVAATIRYELADHPDGTLVTIHATGEPGWYFRWATPLLARQVRGSIAADLERLRDRLERQDG